MRRLIACIMLFVLLCPLLSGCASMSGAGKGAITGATIGGIAGALIAGRNGALIGAYAGTLLGAVAGDYHDRKVASRASAINKYSYNYSREMIIVEGASIEPAYARPSTAIDARVQYTVLAPGERQQLRVVETRTLVVGDERVELARREVIRTQGTYVTGLRITLPRDLPRGNHTLITTISNGKVTKFVNAPVRVV